MHLSRPIALLLWAVMLILAACDAIPADSSIVVRPDEIAVVYAQDTGALRTILTEGRYDIQPLQEDVLFYPLFWQVYSFRDEFTLNDGALGGDAIEARTLDETEIRVNLSFVFRVNADEVDVIFDSWGSDDYRPGYIRPTARRVVKDIIGVYSARSLSTLAASDLQVQIENALRSEFEANGFLLQRVDLGEVVVVE